MHVYPKSFFSAAEWCRDITQDASIFRGEIPPTSVMRPVEVVETIVT